MKRLDPTLDVTFKLLLLREPALLCDMVEGILAKPVRTLDVLNPDILGELASDKEIVLDIRVGLTDGSRADVEMQTRLSAALPCRLVYYGSRDYSDQLRRGDEYHLLTPTVVIAWLVEPLFPSLRRLHSIFELRERHTHMLFGDQLSIHLLQLSQRSQPASLSSSPLTGYDAKVDRWARFLVARDDAELDRLASEDPIMSLAQHTLEQLSQDPTARRLARERTEAIKLYNIDLLASRREGRREGRAEGEANLLLKLLGLRFGPVPDAVRARVRAATLQQLDLWAARVLTAQSPEEVLA